MEWNLVGAFEAVSTAVPTRVAVVHGDRRLTYGALRQRAYALGRGLRALGLGFTGVVPASGITSPQPHVALYLRNSPDHLVALLGCFAARAVPLNVNYRYQVSELRHLFEDADAAAVVYEPEFADQLSQVVELLDERPVLIELSDRRTPVLPEATPWHEVLGAGGEMLDPVPEDLSPDDRYLLYTGGTTGFPKGVLWRQADIFAAILDGREGADVPEHESVESLVQQAHGSPSRLLATPPFMHGAGQWTALGTLYRGGTVVIQDDVSRFDPADVCRTAAREGVTELVVVGDAIAQPLLDELERADHDLSALEIVLNVGAFLRPATKHRLLALLPHVQVVDGVGATEMGGGLTATDRPGEGTPPGVFEPDAGACVIAEDRSRVERPGHHGIGWLAKAGRIPLGYLGDPERTAATFPTIDGQRLVVPGDRARHRADGRIELLGRDGATINTGGEKVFAEEVEGVLVTAPGVLDAVVVSRPSERWGEEVVALVATEPGAPLDAEALRSHCRADLAGYKVPKAIIWVPEIRRSPAGKADYRWAREVASSTPGSS